LGLPNVGKSSVINRLFGRTVATRAAEPGTTRKMIWHRIGGFRNTQLECLDTPGLIPIGFAKRISQEQQQLLCITGAFTEKLMNRTLNFFHFVFRLGKLADEYPHLMEAKTVWEETERKYKVDWRKALRYEGPIFGKYVPAMNPDPFCGKMLRDFNKGELGRVQLEPPPAEPRSAKDWDSLLKGSTPKRKHLEEVQIRGALGPGEERVNLPATVTTEDGEVREKVPVWVRSNNVSMEGLFDGW